MKRRTFLKGVSVLIANASWEDAAHAALFPKFYSEAVAALGVIVKGRWHTIGTAFFYGAELPNFGVGDKEFIVFLVTASHVLEKSSPLQLDATGELRLQARLGTTSRTSAGLLLDFSEIARSGFDWIKHPQGQDVSVLPVNTVKLKNDGWNGVFLPDNLTATKSTLLRESIQEGDGIFTLGFPLDNLDAIGNDVIVRQGIIARMSNLNSDLTTTYTIDSFVFPGSSGSPVIHRPELVANTGTSPPNHAYLMGMIIRAYSYDDVAASRQTGQDRVVFEENAGLAEVLTMDSVKDVIRPIVDRFTEHFN